MPLPSLRLPAAAAATPPRRTLKCSHATPKPAYPANTGTHKARVISTLVDIFKLYIFDTTGLADKQHT